VAEHSREIILAPASVADVDDRDARGFFSQGVSAPIKLKTDVLRDNLAGFLDAMNEALQGLPQVVQGFKLEEIELVVEVSGEGSIQLLGGVKVGASGGITLKLKR
jgi:hypothetical protein